MAGGRKLSAVAVTIALAGAYLVAAAPAAHATVPCLTSCYVDAVLGSDADPVTGRIDAPFKTIQAAIDAVQPGGTVFVRPGNYSETAAARTPTSIGGTYDFGLFVPADKAGISIRGVTAAGAAVTTAAGVVAHVTTNSTASFGPVGVFVEADGVTIRGLGIGENLTDAVGCATPGTCTRNRTIEAVGDSFTLDASTVDDFFGSVYLDDPRYDVGLDTPHVTRYAITNNTFAHGVSVDLAHGVGGGPNGGATSGRVISGNTFAADGGVAACPPALGCSTGQVAKATVAYHGAVLSGDAPVGPASITGNTFGVGRENISRSFGPLDTSPSFPWAAYLNGNTFASATVDTPDGNADHVRSFAAFPYPSVERIGGSLQAPHPGGCVAADCNGDLTNAATGDTLLVKGSLGEGVVLDRDMTIQGLASASLTAPTNGTGTGIEVVDPATVTVGQLGVTGFATGVAVDGGVASLVQNRVTSNGTGVRLSGGSASVGQNDITGNGVGVAVTGGDTHVNLNAISGSTLLDMKSTLPGTDATCNWWGSALGPSAGKVDANVTYGPYWLVSATPRTLANCRPVVSLATGNQSVVEGAPGDHTTLSFDVSLSAAYPTPVTVHWSTVDGTATGSDGDFVTASGDLTFPADSIATQSFAVTVNGDSKLETYQSFQVRLSSPTDAGIGVGSASIEIRNDERPLAKIPRRTRLPEGQTVQFKVTLAQRYYQPIDVYVSTADLAARAPVDYGALTAYRVTIPAGSLYATVPVVINRDATSEPAEDFALTGTSPNLLNTPTSTGTIRLNST